jgi:hypothetical protein
LNAGHVAQISYDIGDMGDGWGFPWVFLRLRTAMEALLSEANELPQLEEVWHKNHKTMMKQLDDNMMKRYNKHRHRSVKTKVKSFDQNL